MAKRPVRKDNPKARAIWRHNSYFGHARMTQMQMLAIMRSDTATSASKAIAGEIHKLAEALNASLKTRKGSEGGA